MNNLNLRTARKRSRIAAKGTKKYSSRVWNSRIEGFVRHSRMLYFLLGLIFGLSAYLLELPTRIVNFRDNYPEAEACMYDKIYSPSNWTGIFDTFPEGNVDINDMALFSPVEAALDLAVYDGNKLDGTIWWQGSCGLGLPYQGILIRGDIKLGGLVANVEVYDFKGGHRISLFTGVLKNDGLIIEISQFPSEMGLNGSRIAIPPHASNS